MVIDEHGNASSRGGVGGPESGFTTEQIEGWNEFSWANDEYQRLDDLQESEMDPDKRTEYIHQMQEAMEE